eukprot:1194371-Prorocentrum_minimum.AAC.2
MAMGLSSGQSSAVSGRVPSGFADLKTDRSRHQYKRCAAETRCISTPTPRNSKMIGPPEDSRSESIVKRFDMEEGTLYVPRANASRRLYLSELPDTVPEIGQDGNTGVVLAREICQS